MSSIDSDNLIISLKNKILTKMKQKKKNQRFNAHYEHLLIL